MGRTAAGREIPYVIASRPRVRTPQQAMWLYRPIVYVQANIHAGEVEGKEALQMLLRDLASDSSPSPLDSVVLIAVPIYNVDGNEAVGPQALNRPEQNGPAMVGGRVSANDLNLNRDYMKAEAPETRASLAMFNVWDPDVFVDLHTTDGSLHGYAVTYAPPLNPAAPLADYTREWLAVLRQRMRWVHGFETFDYGNFGTNETPWQQRLVYERNTRNVHAWSTFDSQPRYSTNYYGLRNGVAILVEGYSHDPFQRRVASTYAFLREILVLAGERSTQLRERRALAVRAMFDQVDSVPIRAKVTSAPVTADVLVEEVFRLSDSVVTEPGLPPGLLRSGRFRAVRMPVYDRFEPTQWALLPMGYIVPKRLSNVLANLSLHGIEIQRVGERRTFLLDEFRVSSIWREERPFERHRETRIEGAWVMSRERPANDDWFIDARQPLGRLAMYLLEPQSDDGLVNWNFVDSELATASRYPVFRVHYVPNPVQ